MASEILLVNPRKRTRKKSTAKKRRSPATARRRRSTRTVSVKRNPIRRRSRAVRRSKGMIGEVFMPAAFGALSAVGVDVAYGLLPIPATMKTGKFAPFVKLGVGLGLGYGAGKVLGKKKGEMIMAGFATVTLYNIAKNLIQSAVPALPMGEYPSLEYVQAGQFLPGTEMGEYISEYETEDDYMGEYIS